MVVRGAGWEGVGVWVGVGSGVEGWGVGVGVANPWNNQRKLPNNKI